MRLLNFRKKKVEASIPTNKDSYRYQTYSSPLHKIGEGDLTKPYINTNILNSNNYVPFGDDNLFPQLIDQMYYQSSIHASIIDFQVNSAIGGGYEIISPLLKKSGEDKVNEFEFFRKIKIDQILKGISLDLKMHKRCHFKVTKKGNDIIKFERVLPAKVRYNNDASRFWISEDWTGYRNVKIYDEYDPTYETEEVTKSLSYINLGGSPGQDIYPLDRTISAFNWCYLDGQSPNLQKKNIEKSIFGNLIIKRPNEFKSTEEFNLFKRGIENKEGDIVPVLLLTANGKENLPEIESFPANENDKAFENLDKRIDDKICQAHTINPIIMGIERPGALGSGSDILAAYPIWEKNVLNPFRNDIENVLDEIMYIFEIRGKFKLKDFSLIEMKKED